MSVSGQVKRGSGPAWAWVVGILAFIILGPFTCVILPALQDESDRKIKRRYRSEMEVLVDSLYHYSDLHGSFPERLEKIVPIIQAQTNASVFKRPIPGALEDYVYLRPKSHERRFSMNETKALLIEKLNHYRYTEGGHIAFLGGRIAWYYAIGDSEYHTYFTILKTNAVPLRAVGDPKTPPPRAF
jgi:hypothetical protein